MTLQLFSIIAGLTSLLLSVIALLIGLYALVLIIAANKSTHSVQMIPMDEEIEKANEEYSKKWSTTDSAINEQNQLHREETSDVMPEFSLNEDDLEKFSI